MLALLNPVRLMMAGTVSESRFNLFHPVAPVARTGGALLERRGGLAAEQYRLGELRSAVRLQRLSALKICAAG